MQTPLQQLLRRLETDRKVGKPSPVKSRSIFSARSIDRSQEFLRIAGIEQRDWHENAAYLVEQMTPLLKTPQGQQELREVQAAILHDLWVYRGAMGIIRVGGGKTLITLLAPYICESFRPLLVIPASLEEKTQRDKKMYSQHWKVPQFIRTVHYEWLAVENQANFLDTFRPDLVLLDEGHRCKNTGAVVTQRIVDYRNDCVERDDYPDPPPFLIMSGTLTKDSIKDYWHLLRLVLPEEIVPLPIRFTEMIQWSMALDARVGELNRVKPGALLDLCNEEEKEIAVKDPLQAARNAYRRRLHSTPGVICTTDTYEASSLRIQERRLKPPDQILKYFRMLREYTAPDGHPIQDGSVVAQRAMELALGFYQRWKYPPPPAWMDARSEWYSTCRRIIKYNRNRHYSEQQVKTAIDAGNYKQHKKILETWRVLDPTFKPNVEAVWISDFALKFVATWAKKHKGIVWVYHPEFGNKLSEMTGMPYYHDGGFDAAGIYIESHPPGTPMIASIKANMFGKNLQLITNCGLMTYLPSSGEMWEQIIGRTHRENQPEDEVYMDVMVTCIEHLRAFWRAKELDAQYVEDTALKHKLLFADITVTTMDEVVANKGSLWEETLPVAA